jgi:MFS transporter, SP family, galactose:H+ symporter
MSAETEAASRETHSPQSRTAFKWSATAALGGFLLGYHSGVISGALLFIRRDFDLGSFEQGALVALFPLGAMFGGLVATRIAESWGRRRTLIATAIAFIVATLLSVVASSLGVLLVARGLTGVAAGVGSSAVPLYTSEIAPPAMRGRLVSLAQLMITLGILASYLVDLAFASSGSWEWMLGAGLVPAAAMLVGMRRAPETPAWLDAHGRGDEATKVLRRVADSQTAESMLEDLRRAGMAARAQLGWRALWEPLARPALVVGVTLAAIAQFSGINAIIYYAPRIMEQAGLSASNSILYAVIIGVINVAATVVSFRVVDRIGRRPLLLMSLAGALVSLALLGLTFALPHGEASNLLSLLCILGYVIAFAIGLGPVFWLLIVEIFPPATRTAGASVSSATNWFTNFVVGLAFLPIVDAIGEGPTFWLFAAVCLFGLVFVNRYVPETKGRGFGEIEEEVRLRWGRGPLSASRPSRAQQRGRG